MNITEQKLYFNISQSSFEIRIEIVVEQRGKGNDKIKVTPMREKKRTSFN